MEEYRLEGVEDAGPLYRLATAVLGPERAPARQLAALYRHRWEIETGFDELKTPPGVESHRPAQQDARLGAAGVPRPAAGALRRAEVDARGGPESRRGPGPTLVGACRASDPPQAAHLRRNPLGKLYACMRPFWTRFLSNGSNLVRAVGTGVG